MSISAIAKTSETAEKTLVICDVGEIHGKRAFEGKVRQGKGSSRYTHFSNTKGGSKNISSARELNLILSFYFSLM